MDGVERVEIPAVVTGPDAPVVDKSLSDKPQTKPLSGSEPARPEWCPEKFWKDGQVNTEALAKSYQELEKRKPSEPPKGEAPKSEPPKGEQPPEEQPQVKYTLPGITEESAAKYSQELQESGKLSETAYADLAKAGYPKSMVDAYITGIQASQVAANETVKSIQSIAGGEDQYKAMIGWAQSNLSPEDVAAYDKVMNAGDAKAMDLAARGLHSRYIDAVGRQPQLLGGNPGGDTKDTFKNTSQIVAAMRDRRYASDDAYRKEVQDKIARSNV